MTTRKIKEFITYVWVGYTITYFVMVPILWWYDGLHLRPTSASPIQYLSLLLLVGLDKLGSSQRIIIPRRREEGGYHLTGVRFK